MLLRGDPSACEHSAFAAASASNSFFILFRISVCSKIHDAPKKTTLILLRPEDLKGRIP